MLQCTTTEDLQTGAVFKHYSILQLKTWGPEVTFLPQESIYVFIYFFTFIYLFTYTIKCIFLYVYVYLFNYFLFCPFLSLIVYIFCYQWLKIALLVSLHLTFRSTKIAAKTDAAVEFPMWKITLNKGNVYICMSSALFFFCPFWS